MVINWAQNHITTTFHKTSLNWLQVCICMNIYSCILIAYGIRLFQKWVPVISTVELLLYLLWNINIESIKSLQNMIKFGIFVQCFLKIISQPMSHSRQ